MKRFCPFCLLMFLSTCLHTFAAPISSFKELKSVMLAGNRLTILLDVSQCTGKFEGPIGYFVPNSMMLLPETKTTLEKIATSHLHFTDHSGIPTYEYVKYTFNADDSVIIRSAFYSPMEFSLKREEHVIHSSIGKGVKIHTDINGQN